MSFQEIARRRGLSTAKLDELTWDVEPCPYQRLKVTSAAELDGLLKLMKRRALEPTLLGFLFDLFDQFPDRPIERALLAYDVVNASLLGSDDGALLERVTNDLLPIRGFAQTGAAVTRDHVSHLIEASRGTSIRNTSTSLLDDLATATPSLAALVQLSETRKDLEDLDDLDDAPELVQGIFAHVRRLELAHLPTLAIAFLQILWDRFANAAALDLLIELAIDHDMIEAIPPLTGADARSMQQQTYLLVRTSCANFDVVTAQRILDAVPDAIRQAPYAPLILARAHLVLLEGKRLDDEAVALVESIVPPGAHWRYGNFVQEAARVNARPQDAAQCVDRFITAHGNNAYLWAQAADHEEARAPLLNLLSREIRYGSHEPHVWRAASILVRSDGAALNNELDQRMHTQLLTALGRIPT